MSFHTTADISLPAALCTHYPHNLVQTVTTAGNINQGICKTVALVGQVQYVNETPCSQWDSFVSQGQSHNVIITDVIW